MTGMRKLGASGFETPPLILGGNVFGWTADRETSFAVLDCFVDAGGTMIDTADVYSAWIDGHSGGESESVIGEWLERSGKRDKVLIATKVGMLPGADGKALDPAHIAEACEASLKRLKTDRIDLYYAHRDDPDIPLEDVAGAFAKLVEAGKVRVLGASNFSAVRLKAALDTATKLGLPHYHVLQPRYNLVSRTEFEGELQDLCIQHNIGVAPYYGLAAGFLTGKYRSRDDLKDRARAGSVADLMTDANMKLLDTMDAIAKETGASLPQIALAWLAAQDGVTAPIASATSIEQLDELIGAWDVTLSDDQLMRLTTATD